MNTTEDLSHYHQPVGTAFSRPASSEQWPDLRLTPEQIASYEKHGYVTGIRLLDDDQVDLLRTELLHLTDPSHARNYLFYEFHSNESGDPSLVLFHALGAWRITPGFHDLLWNPRFVIPAAQLLGGPVRFWHDQLFCKPAGHGGVVAWHQDYSYWTRTRPMAHLSCWIALDAADRNNGCLHYVPGSHRWKLLPKTGLAGDMNAIQTVLSHEQRKQFSPVPIELKSGEAAFHHPLIVHGSFANFTDRARRAAVLNVFLDGVRSATDEPLLQGVPVIPHGEKVQGQFFPLLFDPRTIGWDLATLP